MKLKKAFYLTNKGYNNLKISLLLNTIHKTFTRMKRRIYILTTLFLIHKINFDIHEHNLSPYYFE